MRALGHDELCGRSSAVFEAGRPRRNVEFAAGERGREMLSLLQASEPFKKEYVINALKINSATAGGQMPYVPDYTRTMHHFQ